MDSFQHWGELAALGTALCWTGTAIAFESAGKRIGSLVVNFVRLVIAVFFLSALTLATRGLPFPTDATTHHWIWLAVSGWVGFNIGDLCLFRAFVLLGSRTSVLIMSSVPPITAILGWFLLRESLRPLDLLAIVLTVTGIAWVVSQRRNPNATAPEERGHRTQGVLLAFGGAIGQAGGLILSKYGMQDYDPFAATQIRIYAGIVGFVILFFVTRWWPRVFAGIRDGTAMLRTSIGAFFGPFLGVSLSLVAVQRTETGVAATLMAMTPIFILFPTWYIYREPVPKTVLAGTILAVVGSVLLFM